jgi:hypothetical protein
VSSRWTTRAGDASSTVTPESEHGTTTGGKQSLVHESFGGVRSDAGRSGGDMSSAATRGGNRRAATPGKQSRIHESFGIVRRYRDRACAQAQPVRRRAPRAGPVRRVDRGGPRRGRRDDHRCDRARRRRDSEAQRLSAENPNSVIHIGGDQRAPRRVSDPTAVMPAFDLTVETSDGGAIRSVEVTTVDAPVSQVGDITPGLRHAIDKVESRARPPDPRDAHPIPGDREVTIRMTLAVGDAPLRGGRVRRIAPNGEVRIIDGDGQFRVRPGNPTNIYEDIATNLGAVAHHENLSRVTLVDQSTHAVLARYERAGTIWKRIP